MEKPWRGEARDQEGEEGLWEDGLESPRGAPRVLCFEEVRRPGEARGLSRLDGEPAYCVA